MPAMIAVWNTAPFFVWISPFCKRDKISSPSLTTALALARRRVMGFSTTLTIVGLPSESRCENNWSFVYSMMAMIFDCNSIMWSLIFIMRGWINLIHQTLRIFTNLLHSQIILIFHLTSERCLLPLLWTNSLMISFQHCRSSTRLNNWRQLFLSPKNCATADMSFAKFTI